MRSLVLLLLSVISFYSYTMAQDDECIFDQATQTSEFLDTVSQFQDYTWVDSIVTAFIALPNADSLEIKRGGCVHFGYYFTLITEDTNALNQIDHWFEIIQGYTIKLRGDFDFDYLEEQYVFGNSTLEQRPGQTVLFFQQDMYCGMELWVEEKRGKKVITIGYYLC